MIRLETERLIIRDPEWSDFPSWHKLLSDAKTMYFLDDLRTYSEEDSRQNLSIAISEIFKSNRKKYFFAIEKRDSGENL